MTAPHVTTIAHFASTLRDDFAQVFASVLAVCDGQVLIGREMFAIDGVKLPSNASTHRSGTRVEFTQRAEKLGAAAQTMLDRHRATDALELGPDVAAKTTARIARLRQDAQQVREWLSTHPTDRHGPTGGLRKSNRTDNERAKMAADKGVIQRYTGVAAVDAKHQIIVDAQAPGTGSEHEMLLSVVDALAALRTSDTVLTADAGYHSEANLVAHAAGVARLRTPSKALEQFTVPLRPFLGVVAVAPGGEWIPSSRESGSYGGNLEYAQLTEGTTVYLPVSTMGAYLYLGDGHAAQGDGELTGDAMETSMAVTFSVSVKRWGFARQTRAESAEHLMSLGVGGSLDQAMRRATTDMAQWLESEYKLSSTDAAIVMGVSLKFDVPDVVPPGFGVVARMPKAALASIRVAR